MTETITTVLQYGGAIFSTVAALLVSLNLGRKYTGIGFILFVVGSIMLLLWGFIQPDSEGIGIQNGILLVINCIGVHRYLISKHKPRDH